MKININWKKTGIICGSVIAGLYILFLALPLILSPIANSYCEQIEGIIKMSTGLESHIDGIGVTTSPKLAVGIKIKEFSLYVPNEEKPVIEIEDAKADLRLLPLILKKIQLGNISAGLIEGNIVINKDGIPAIIEYLPEQSEESEELMQFLPFGIKLSNHLPNVRIKDYKLAFIDAGTQKSYYIDGNNLKVSDFILDKKINISTEGEIVFDKRVVSKYDIKVSNKIMPNVQLDDLIFPKEVKIEENSETDTNENNFKFNIIDIFEAVNKNGLKADLKTNIKTSGTFKNPDQKGEFELVGMSVAVDGKQLPESYLKLLFKGKQTDIDSIFYTSSDINEKTQIMGSIKSDKNRYVSLTFSSNAKLNNIIRLIDFVARSFGYDDLKTVSASGAVDADFNVSSDLATVTSSGHLKVPSASLKYGLYNILVDNINADINLDENNINIKNVGFSVMGHPLKIVGKISSDAVADLKIIAEKLSLKGLVGAAGQVNLLSENEFNSGTISLNALIKGKLNELKPDITLSADNLNIYNKPAQARLLLTQALIKILLNKESINGDIDLNALKIKHDMASVSVPKALVSIDSKNINIKNSYVMINNSKVDVSGSVKDYSNANMNMDINAKGNLASADVAAFIPKEFKSMFSYTGSMPVSVVAKGNDKVQHITFDLSATPNGYVKFLDINKLKGKNTKIHTDVKIENNSAILENSGIFANSDRIATFDGGVKNLSNPNMNINISVPKNVSFPIPGMGNNSNITANGAVNLGGNPMNPKLKGKANVSDISIKDMDFVLSNLVANMNGQGISGDATAQKMKFGGIIVTNISGKFSLDNFTVFNLNDLKADVFSGKVNGKLTYHLPTFAFGVDFIGKGLNSTDAVYGAVGIPKALTGTMNFDAKLTSKGITDVEIIKNLKGDIDFGIENGRFVSIGKLENLVAAQNITSNSILKSALSALTTAANIQETNKFKSITGEMSMGNGSANISFINVSGPLMSYYVNGIYNILQNSANMTILGRLDSKVVSYLGPLGQLSAEKLLSYIPKFGPATAKYLQLLTQSPKKEELALIPALSSGSAKYKDFKVIFNGSLEKATSVKSFRWLSTCDTTQMNVKQEVQNAVQAAKDNVKNQVESIKNTAENVKSNVNKVVETQKQKVETEKKAVEQTKQDVQKIKQNAGQSAVNLGNLLKNAASNANKKMEVPSAKTETSAPAKTEIKTEVKTESSSAQTQESSNAE